MGQFTRPGTCDHFRVSTSPQSAIPWPPSLAWTSSSCWSPSPRIQCAPGRPQRTDGMENGDIFESLVVSMAIYGHVSQQSMALHGTVPPF